jgi:hypothetical protein
MEKSVTNSPYGKEDHPRYQGMCPPGQDVSSVVTSVELGMEV